MRDPRHPLRRGAPDPISPDAGERLLRGGPGDDPDQAAVAAVLASAAGPARPHELAGERAAVAAFAEASRDRAADHRRTPRRGRRLGAVTAAAVAALLFGGAAYAAGTGRLPDALQQTIDHLLPTADAPAPVASPTTTDRRPGSNPPDASPTPPPTDGPAEPAQQTALCRSWLAFRADPHAGPITAEARHALAEAAGGAGERTIDAFCHRLLDPTPAATTTSVKPGNPAPGNGKPSHPPKPTKN